MRALTFDGRALRLNSAAQPPAPCDGEVIIRPIRASISRADLAICSGAVSFQGVIGHQFVGVVEDGKWKGKRVVASPVTSCGECEWCTGGMGAHCRKRTILGVLNRDGCLADLFTMPAKNLVEVPGSVDDDHAVFAVELAAAIQAARQLTVVGKPYITVLGDNTLALLTAQVMNRLNASVRVIGVDRGNLAVCEKWSVKHRLADDIGRRADQDVVVECTGSISGFTLATQLVRPRGTIILKSLSTQTPGKTDRASDDLSNIILNEITLIGSSFGPVSEAISMLERREIDVVSLISKRMNLRDGPAIIQQASRSDTLAVLVDI